MGCLRGWVAFLAPPDGRSLHIRWETSENKHLATVVGSTQAGGGSIMVWWTFSCNCQGWLVPPEDTFNWYGYLSIIVDQVCPRQCNMLHHPNCVCAWFEEHNQDLQLLPWLPDSPGFNLIEHLWDHLGRHIRRMDPPQETARTLRCASVFMDTDTHSNLSPTYSVPLVASGTAKGSFSGC